MYYLLLIKVLYIRKAGKKNRFISRKTNKNCSNRTKIPLTKNNLNLPLPAFFTMKTTLATKDNHKKEWHLIDAEGEVLGRLAVQIANILEDATSYLHTTCRRR